jgi:long-chain-fatty-acid--CoA ligase ACSBG
MEDFAKVAGGRMGKEPALVAERLVQSTRAGAALSSGVSSVTDGYTVAPGPPIQWTWREYYARVVGVARAFIALGVEQFDSVAIMGFNSPQWFTANLGSIAVGAKSAGIYTTSSSDQCLYIVAHCSASVVLVENAQYLKRFLSQGADERLSSVKAFVVWGDDAGTQAVEKDRAGGALADVPIYTWDQFVALGLPEGESNVIPQKAIKKKGAGCGVDAKSGVALFGTDELGTTLTERVAAQDPGQCCTLIYTSGTTGQPKAVMISHDNLTWTAYATIHTFGEGVNKSQVHEVVSYLPLSHIASQLMDIHMPIQAAAYFDSNVICHFARPDALKGSLRDTLLRVRPTFFFGVPRVWEKFQAALLAVGSTKGPVARKVSTWAKSKVLETYEDSVTTGEEAPPSDLGRRRRKKGPVVAEALLKGVRKKLGLDRCRLCFTGAAPIGAETLRYFGSLGLEVFEMYGMSECDGPHTLSLPGTFQIGACGLPMEGVETKVVHDPDRDRPGEGEICMRGRHIFMGYLGEEGMSRATIDDEGWLHSGDVGAIDESLGFLRITSRVKELIVTSGGENVAPVPLEDAVKARLPAIKNVVLVGDRRRFVSALITLHLDGDEESGFTDELVSPSADVSPASLTPADARNDPAWQAYIMSGIDYANTNVAPNVASTIRKFVILDTDFSIVAGHLTSTMKLKRSVIHEEFEHEINALYSGTAGGGGVRSKGVGGGSSLAGSTASSRRHTATTKTNLISSAGSSTAASGDYVGIKSSFLKSSSQSRRNSVSKSHAGSSSSGAPAALTRETSGRRDGLSSSSGAAKAALSTSTDGSRRLSRRPSRPPTSLDQGALSPRSVGSSSLGSPGRGGAGSSLTLVSESPPPPGATSSSADRIADTPASSPWWRPHLDRQGAEAALSVYPPRCFVLRPSRFVGSIALSHRKPDLPGLPTVGHCVIRPVPGGGYVIESQSTKHESLTSLLEFLELDLEASKSVGVGLQ